MQEITKENNSGNSKNNGEKETGWDDVWNNYIKTYSYPPKETLHLWNHCKDMKYQVKYSEVKNIFPSLQIKYNVQDSNLHSSRRHTVTASQLKKQTQIDKKQFDDLIQQYENKYKYHPKDAKMLFNFCIEDLHLHVKYGAVSRAFSTFYKPPNDRQRRHSMPAVMTRFGHFVEYEEFIAGKEQYKTPLTNCIEEEEEEEEEEAEAEAEAEAETTATGNENNNNENHNIEPGNNNDKQNTQDNQENHDHHDHPEGVQNDDKDTKTTPTIGNVEQTTSGNIENTPNGNVENTTSVTANEDTSKVTGTMESVTDNGEPIPVRVEEDSTDNKKTIDVTPALFEEMWQKYLQTFQITPQNVTQLLNFALKNGYNVTYIAIRNVWPSDIPENS